MMHYAKRLTARVSRWWAGREKNSESRIRFERGKCPKIGANPTSRLHALLAGVAWKVCHLGNRLPLSYGVKLNFHEIIEQNGSFICSHIESPCDP